MPLQIPRVPLLLTAVGIAALAITAMGMHSRPTAPKSMPMTAQPDTPAAPAPVVAATPVIARRAKSAPVGTPARMSSAPRELAPGEAGMRIEMDPETGAPGLAHTPVPPLSAVPRDDEAALSHSDQGLQQVVLPDGSVMVDLQGRFQEYAVMEIGPDGKLRMRCVQRPDAPAPAAPATEVVK